MVDAGVLLTGQPCGAARFVVLRVAERSVALAVDAVVGTERIDAGELEQLPPLLAGATDLVRAMTVLDGRLLDVLESGRVIELAMGTGGGEPPSSGDGEARPAGDPRAGHALEPA